MRTTVLVASTGAAASLALTLDNARRIRRPDPMVVVVPEPLTVLVPVRDEVDDVGGCLAALRVAADRWPGPIRILVLDDESTDGTDRVLAELAQADERIEVMRGTPTPPGWLGKSWACEQLSRNAETGILVFVDADVRVAPDALVASAALLRATGLDLLSPYPRQHADGPAERLVQPLLQWSWMSTLPLGLAERSSRPSMSAANGQFLVVDAAAYRRAGGHVAVRAEVLEDIALLRAVKRSGGRGVAADGSAVASCHMYHGWREVRAGYRKSLWSAFGSVPGTVAVVALLNLLYVVPPIAALRGSRVGLLGYLLGVASRVISARSTGGRSWPDALAHPISILTFTALTADSVVARRTGRLTWKGRTISGPTR
ncbi:glycosyltransferase [Gordonia sp. HNM0687]|uniref:Glycosyltransferase n=1 Tax=Gordonia mangrovi TaxID=2665643 RepID=A0A6L7GP96_9ACTN|nr:glycosyltransferase family 2 protein [Gordonia mangrovi]MXP21729.1 glycosyltransferase [Gordonia mangrovi]UVF80460.1 glycosyltransferase [Gordonia mangrovi]